MKGDGDDMIFASRFKGDTNEWVMGLQHDDYGLMLSRLLRAAQRKLQSAEALVQVQTIPGAILENEVSFDHRTLQSTHDSIAAYFRFKCADELQPQLNFSKPISEEKRVREMWRKFFDSEVDRLTDIPSFTRDIVTAVAFANQDEGYKAEDRLFEFMKDQYGGYLSNEG